MSLLEFPQINITPLQLVLKQELFFIEKPVCYLFISMQQLLSKVLPHNGNRKIIL